MDDPDPSSPPSGFERAKRRLFGRGEPAETIVVADGDAADLTAAVERVVSERMQDAVGAIQETAASLMHEVAAEVWRTAAGDKRDVQARLLEALTRDQAIRSLIAHSDERFQSLTVRTARLEDTLQRLADHTYEATESLTRGVRTLEDAVKQPAVMEIGDLRDRLSNVVHQISRALETITERDRIIVEAIGERLRDHGTVLTQETTRIAEAMEGYVQQGVSTIGQLAGRVDTQLAETAGRFDAQIGELTQRATEVFQEQMALMGQHPLEGPGSIRETIEELDRRSHERVVNMARLVRADSERMHQELARMRAEQNDAFARALDDKVARVAHALEERAEAATNALDRNLLRLSDNIDAQLARVGGVVGQQTAKAADATITAKFEGTLDRMYSSAAAIERVAADVLHAQRRSEEDLAKLVDNRVTALARMLRSDNETIAAQLNQEQDAAKQSLRAVKELQANLPEQVARIADALERRIDEMASRISQRYDNDIQVVVERMGDAMHALGSLGRPRSDRVDLE